jgi:hypothetical protein
MKVQVVIQQNVKEEKEKQINLVIEEKTTNLMKVMKIISKVIIDFLYCKIFKMMFILSFS